MVHVVQGTFGMRCSLVIKSMSFMKKTCHGTGHAAGTVAPNALDVVEVKYGTHRFRCLAGVLDDGSFGIHDHTLSRPTSARAIYADDITLIGNGRGTAQDEFLLPVRCCGGSWDNDQFRPLPYKIPDEFRKPEIITDADADGADAGYLDYGSVRSGCDGFIRPPGIHLAVCGDQVSLGVEEGCGIVIAVTVLFVHRAGQEINPVCTSQVGTEFGHRSGNFFGGEFHPGGPLKAQLMGGNKRKPGAVKLKHFYLAHQVLLVLFNLAGNGRDLTRADTYRSIHDTSFPEEMDIDESL